VIAPKEYEGAVDIVRHYLAEDFVHAARVRKAAKQEQAVAGLYEYVREIQAAANEEIFDLRSRLLELERRLRVVEGRRAEVDAPPVRPRSPAKPAPAEPQSTELRPPRQRHAAAEAPPARPSTRKAGAEQAAPTSPTVERPAGTGPPVSSRTPARPSRDAASPAQKPTGEQGAKAPHRKRLPQL
jgi:hypothetical protein